MNFNNISAASIRNPIPVVLLVNRRTASGSEIIADGTAQDPIIFSSEDEGIAGSGEFGGLILHGNRPREGALDEVVNE